MRQIRLLPLMLGFISSLVFLRAAPYVHPNGTWLIDPMEGYAVDAKGVPDIVEFKDPSGLVNIQVYAFQPNRFASSKALYTFVKERFKLRDTVWTGEWGEYDWYASSGELGLNTNGFQALVETLYQKNAVSYCVIGFVQKKYYGDKEAQIVSALDSFAPSSNYLYQPGVMSRVSGPLRPAANPSAVTFGGEPFVVNFGDGEMNAMNRLLEREKKILFQLGGAQGADREKIMLRFYRMIYRNAWPTVARFTEAIEPFFKKKKWALKDRVGFVWGGIYMYEFKEQSGDDVIVSPYDLILKGVGDCDSKAVLMHLMLDQIGAKSEILLSFEEGHATIGLPKEYFEKLQPAVLKGHDGTPLHYVEVERKYAAHPKGRADVIPEQWISIRLKY